MKKHHPFPGVLGLLLALLLTVPMAGAYADDGFSLEIPEDWIPDTQVEGIAYGWTNPEVTQEVTVSIVDNDDFLNLYDLKEDDLPDIEEIKAYCHDQVDHLWDEVKRFENPHNYYVDLSQKLWDIKQDLLRKNYR